MDKTDLLQKLLQRPVAYHASLTGIAGVTGAVMLSQAIYWTGKIDEEREGWFYKTRDEWIKETGLSRREQQTARKFLCAAGVLEEKLQGIPAQLWFRVNYARLLSWYETYQLVGTENLASNQPQKARTNKVAPNVPTYYTETTTEITHSVENPIENSNEGNEDELTPAEKQRMDREARKLKKKSPYGWKSKSPFAAVSSKVPKKVSGSLEPLTKEQLCDIARELKVHFVAVKLKMKEVLDAVANGQAEKYNISDIGRTTKMWLQREIQKGEIEVLSEDWQIESYIKNYYPPRYAYQQRLQEVEDYKIQTSLPSDEEIVEKVKGLMGDDLKAYKEKWMPIHEQWAKLHYAIKRDYPEGEPKE